MTSMTELQMAILTSVALNLMKDGKADLSALSPVVQEYLIGILEDYDASDDEEQEHLYWFAHTTLSDMLDEKEKKGILH
jgi:hypothetical protein